MNLFYIGQVYRVLYLLYVCGERLNIKIRIVRPPMTWLIVRSWIQYLDFRVFSRRVQALTKLTPFHSRANFIIISTILKFAFLSWLYRAKIETFYRTLFYSEPAHPTKHKIWLFFSFSFQCSLLNFASLKLTSNVIMKNTVSI